MSRQEQVAALEAEVPHPIGRPLTCRRAPALQPQGDRTAPAGVRIWMPATYRRRECIDISAWQGRRRRKTGLRLPSPGHR